VDIGRRERRRRGTRQEGAHIVSIAVVAQSKHFMSGLSIPHRVADMRSWRAVPFAFSLLWAAAPHAGSSGNLGNTYPHF
jgi:hypothetical protein